MSMRSMSGASDELSAINADLVTRRWLDLRVATDVAVIITFFLAPSFLSDSTEPEDIEDDVDDAGEDEAAKEAVNSGSFCKNSIVFSKARCSAS
ncbi:hypothetical protein PsorP6_002824 [Peronosclerospora sorghi]|uniref:Uncharacterized protein n=1 Tax=Peronosclerospora sorghi TaxID=230839 RepID=A0ACC0VR27_9STRA|nr:hypothetical protein PsorP6_002824 [Peronosclerospora sorghi]